MVDGFGEVVGGLFPVLGVVFPFEDGVDHLVDDLVVVSHGIVP